MTRSGSSRANRQSFDVAFIVARRRAVSSLASRSKCLSTRRIAAVDVFDVVAPQIFALDDEEGLAREHFEPRFEEDVVHGFDQRVGVVKHGFELG